MSKPIRLFMGCDMSVLIGHASIAETGTIHGTAGDQNGKEVCTRPYYVHKNGWKYVLRPSADIAEKAALACEDGCKNPALGYSQPQRNSLHTEAQRVGYDLKKISTPCSCDCSSFMTICAIAAGVKSLEYTQNAPTTSTMKDAFARTGKFEVLTDSKYLTSDKYLKRGDILLAPGYHTVMVLSNGEKALKSVHEIALEVLDDKWGIGKERKIRLEAAGYSYKAVQDEVNRIWKERSSMKTSDFGIRFIQQFESCKLTAYRDIGGTLSIGWGHTGSDVYEGMKITQQRADDLFRKDLEKFETAVIALGFTLTQGQFDALVSFSYNCGIGNLKTLVANRDYKQIADAMMLYNKARVNGVLKPVAGLTRRRKAEREMFLS